MKAQFVLTTALHGDVRLTPWPGRFTPGKSLSIHWRRLGWPQGRFSRLLAKRKSLCPPPEFEPRTVQPTASYYTDWAIPAPYVGNIDLKFLHRGKQLEFKSRGHWRFKIMTQWDVTTCSLIVYRRFGVSSRLLYQSCWREKISSETSAYLYQTKRS